MVPWSKEGTEGGFDLDLAGSFISLPSASTGVPGEAEAESSCETEAEEREAGQSTGCTGAAEAGTGEADTGGDTCVVAQTG